MKSNIALAALLVVSGCSIAGDRAPESPLGSIKLAGNTAVSSPVSAPAAVADKAPTPRIATTTPPAPVATTKKAAASVRTAKEVAAPKAVFDKAAAAAATPAPQKLTPAPAAAAVTPAPQKLAPAPAAAAATPAPQTVVPAPAADTASAVAQLAVQDSAVAPLIAQPTPKRAHGIALSDRERAFLDQEAGLVREIRLLELQAKAAELRRQIAGPAAPADSVNMPPILPTVGSSVLDVPAPPPARLIGIWGDGRSLHADMFASGTRVSVQAGDTLPGGWKVNSVGRTAVEIQRGKTRETVSMGQ